MDVSLRGWEHLMEGKWVVSNGWELMAKLEMWYIKRS